MAHPAGTAAAVLSMLAWISVAQADPPADVAIGRAWPHTPFVIGSPGRLDAEGDRREPRRYLRDDSAVGAYADIEEVDDSRWLQHEIESYARRSVDCTDLAPAWCRREVRRFGRARVIALAAGAHAQLVWRSGRSRAVCLGWTRIVVTPVGTMTLDAPPEAFAAALQAEFPSDLELRDLADGDGWAIDEVDRLLYYVDQVVSGLAGIDEDPYRRHAVRFVEESLARIAQLRAHREDCTEGESLPPVTACNVAVPLIAALPTQVAEELAAVRAWRSGTVAAGWSAASSRTSSLEEFVSSLGASP